MKLVIPFLALFLLISCKSEEKKSTTTPIQDVPLNERPIPPLPGSNGVSANNVIGGAHYICPKNCINGNGPSAGACPVCQTEMAHNQGFHTTPNANSASPLTPATQTTPAANNGPNANGQWHYTCSNGCAGGAGAAGNCSSCGSTLAHNQAFHS